MDSPLLSLRARSTSEEFAARHTVCSHKCARSIVCEDKKMQGEAMIADVVKPHANKILRVCIFAIERTPRYGSALNKSFENLYFLISASQNRLLEL